MKQVLHLFVIPFHLLTQFETTSSQTQLKLKQVVFSCHIGNNHYRTFVRNYYQRLLHRFVWFVWKRRRTQSFTLVGQVIYLVIVQTATRESLLYCPCWWPDGLLSLARLCWVSIVTLRPLCPSVFSALLSCMCAFAWHAQFSQSHSNRHKSNSLDSDFQFQWQFKLL